MDPSNTVWATAWADGSPTDELLARRSVVPPEESGWISKNIVAKTPLLMTLLLVPETRMVILFWLTGSRLALADLPAADATGSVCMLLYMR
jgi:hypothetical protein